MIKWQDFDIPGPAVEPPGSTEPQPRGTSERGRWWMAGVWPAVLVLIGIGVLFMIQLVVSGVRSDSPGGGSVRPGSIAAPYRGPLASGMRVQRGPNWKWGDQDGGRGGVGTVTEPDRQAQGWWWVKWDNGGRNRYRWGVGGAYDLDVIAGASQSTAPMPSRPRADATRALGDEPLTLKGLGPIRIGMTTVEVSSAIKQPLIGNDREACAMLKPRDAPSGLRLMAIHGRIARIDVSDRTYRSKTGARVGDTEQYVTSLYHGRLQVERHKYVEGGHYLVFVPEDESDRGYRMVFETDGRHITSFRAGKIPEVQYVEHCS